MAETISMCVIVPAEYMDSIQLVGCMWMVICGPVASMSDFNGLENGMLTLQPASNSMATVWTSPTGPGSMFWGSVHYRGGSPLHYTLVLVISLSTSKK